MVLNTWIILKKHAIGESKSFSNEQARVGFLAGNHLLDDDFDLEKNVFGDALHFAVRIDTNQVPAAIRRAWLQIELAMLTADSPGRRPTKVQRQEAKDAVEARCEEAARTRPVSADAAVPRLVGCERRPAVLRRNQRRGK